MRGSDSSSVAHECQLGSLFCVSWGFSIRCCSALLTSVCSSAPPPVLKLLKMAVGMRALLDTVMQALPQVPHREDSTGATSSPCPRLASHHMQPKLLLLLFPRGISVLFVDLCLFSAAVFP